MYLFVALLELTEARSQLAERQSFRKSRLMLFAVTAVGAVALFAEFVRPVMEGFVTMAETAVVIDNVRPTL